MLVLLQNTGRHVLLQCGHVICSVGEAGRLPPIPRVACWHLLSAGGAGVSQVKLSWVTEARSSQEVPRWAPSSSPLGSAALTCGFPLGSQGAVGIVESVGPPRPPRSPLL